VLVILVDVLSALSSNAVAQSEEDDAQPIVSRAIAATVDYGNENIFNPAKHATDFYRLGVLADQLLTITVQFPPELAGQIVLVDALDGGGVNVPEEGLTINLDGDVTFQFQTSVAFGACRLTVHQPDDSNFLQFWIVDPEHPENTPPDLPGVY
jgi:hypothetical protein